MINRILWNCDESLCCAAKVAKVDRIGQGLPSPSMLFIKHGLHMFRMNKELLRVQEWTQKLEHALTPINCFSNLLYVPERNQTLSFKMLVFIIKYWFFFFRCWQTCLFSWICSWRFLMITISSSVELPSTPEATSLSLSSVRTYCTFA